MHSTSCVNTERPTRVEAFAAALRAARGSTYPRVKLEAIGRAVGRSASTISRWERGGIESVPDSEDIAVIEDLLQIAGGALLRAAGYLPRDAADSGPSMTPRGFSPPLNIEGAELFASELGGYRRRLRVNQTELGQVLGVDRSTIDRWETGKALPNLAEIAALERFLRLPEDELLKFAQLADPTLARPAVDVPQLWQEDSAPLPDDPASLIALIREASEKLERMTAPGREKKTSG